MIHDSEQHPPPPAAGVAEKITLMIIDVLQGQKNRYGQELLDDPPAVLS